MRGKWPLSLDLLVEVSKADRANQILRFFVSVLEHAGSTHAQLLLGARAINTIDPENIEAILSTQFKDFSLGAREKNFGPLLGHGIFTQNGAEWKYSRDLLRPIFNHQRTDYFTHIQRAAENLLVRVKEDACHGLVDLQPLFFLLTLDVTTAAILGKSTNSLQDRDGKIGLQFARAFDEGQHYLAIRGRLGDFYWVLGGKKFRDACDFVHDFVDKIVQDNLGQESLNSKDGPTTEGYLFIDALVKQTKDARVIRDQLVNVLLAGRDTTACLLSWTPHGSLSPMFDVRSSRLLSQHSDIQQRLRDECVSLPSWLDGNLPTKEELKGMEYLGRVIHEGR